MTVGHDLQDHRPVEAQTFADVLQAPMERGVGVGPVPFDERNREPAQECLELEPLSQRALGAAAAVPLKKQERDRGRLDREQDDGHHDVPVRARYTVSRRPWIAGVSDGGRGREEGHGDAGDGGLETMHP